MIIGILGKAGSGKDTVAGILTRDFSFVSLAFADPMKRFCAEIFSWDADTLWGPSENRNKPDPRYPSQRCAGCQTCEFRCDHFYALTPRHALQQLGTEFGRACYPNIWIEYALRTARRLANGNQVYDPRTGLRFHNDSEMVRPKTNVVITDCRFKNEVKAIQEARGKVIRIKRAGAGLSDEAGDHVSETEQDEIKDEELDYILLNNGSLEDLSRKVAAMLHDIGYKTSSNVPVEAPKDKEEDIKKFLETIPDAPVEVEQVDGEAKEMKLFDGTVDISDIHPGLSALLEKRQKDVEAGRIREYDPKQADVPPFKRKR